MRDRQEATDSRNPRVVSAVKLHRSAARKKAGRFLAEGANSVGAALATGRVRELFYSAEELDASCRTAFLDEACAGDPELRGEVQALLDASNETGDFIKEAVGSAAEKAIAKQNSALDQGRIGPYQIVRTLGRGGMGTVYLAVRADDQYQKQVAIKLVRMGMEAPEGGQLANWLAG